AKSPSLRVTVCESRAPPASCSSTIALLTGAPFVARTLPRIILFGFCAALALATRMMSRKQDCDFRTDGSPPSHHVSVIITQRRKKEKKSLQAVLVTEAQDL